MVAKTSKPFPVYVDRLPPCNNACPIGQNIQKWLYLTRKGKMQEAWEAIMANNPLPASIGRVCYHPCEHACNRYAFDAPININGVERFLGDMALAENWQVAVPDEKSGKKVLIIGAGPAGLACAYHLMLLGHEATIYERGNVGGGVMHYGIPRYRLPRDILDQEVVRIQNMGVNIEYDRPVKDLLQDRDQGKFDAIFIATGAPVGRMVDVPKKVSGCDILEAMEFLTNIENEAAPKLQDLKVVVYGGGNTAIDAARSAMRLGAKEVAIVYRRNREKMPAHDFEVAEAHGEGIELRLLRTIKELDGKNILLEKMELNGEGWPCPTGKTETIVADVIIMALGLNVDTKFLAKIKGIEFGKDGSIIVDEHMQTGCQGIFAGGDVVTYERSVASALGLGKKAAYNIDAYLQNRAYQKPLKNELAGQDKLHTDYYQKSDRKERSQKPLAQCKNYFTEVVQGFSEDEASHEANRCFSCGNCFECDTCYNICPVKAITKLGEGKRYHIDLDICIRCGMCAKKCPCGAIKMEIPQE